MTRARDNPFATHRVHKIRYRPIGWTWDELLQKLESLNYRAAIVGPEGQGKTTLLEDLEPHLRRRGFNIHFLRLHQSNPRLSSLEHELIGQLTNRDIILFDGAELLTLWRWWQFKRLSRRAAGVIITAHHAGLLPTLVECRTPIESVKQIVAELAPQNDQFLNNAEDLWSRFDGNVREMLRALYDESAADSSPRHEDSRSSPSPGPFTQHSGLLKPRTCDERSVARNVERSRTMYTDRAAI